jgi:hypothetical protein
MLFARFLAENGLLREDEGDQPIDLDECRALAANRRLDIWVYAALCAQKMLPGVFRLDNPALELKLDGAAQVELNGLMAGLQPEIFKATDALGWVYQYWQAKRKDEVNASGVKIGAKELSPVTQLFTEDYMVDFLLHNTLGAWWAGTMGPIEAATEEEARAKTGLASKNGLPAIIWTYLRFVQDAETKKWTPAGGTFEGWPKKAKDITFLDPCMGSGHFPVFALPILARMRMEEEGGNAQENIHEVLKAQIYGLELDQRCCQIGAFNLALMAWKTAGFQSLEPLNVACCGFEPQAKREKWIRLAGNDQKLQRGMDRLSRLFENASVLGSLINPSSSHGDLLEASFQELTPLLGKALRQEDVDEDSREIAVIAKGMSRAAEILAGSFTLVATNVPYLGQAKQDEALQEFSKNVYPDSKADLATCFIERCLEFCSIGGSTTLVTPQNWFFLSSYKALRRRLLKDKAWVSVARLGSGAFGTISGEVVNVSLVTISESRPDVVSDFFGIDVSASKVLAEKAFGLASSGVMRLIQAEQVSNPDSAIVLGEVSKFPPLCRIADVYYGSKPGQTSRVTRAFWEVSLIEETFWRLMESSPDGCVAYSGKSEICLSQRQIEEQSIAEFGVRGSASWGKRGVIFAKMSKLPAAVYLGQFYDDNTYTIIPKNQRHAAALYLYVTSEAFSNDLRKINQKLNVTRELVEQLPCDIEYWEKLVIQKRLDGLPKPFSSDPTQWLFNGHPYKSDNPLQVAVARLLCYQWPRQTGASFPDCPVLGPDGLERHADDDGIVALSSINREEAAAPRVRALLMEAYGVDWQDGVTERQLLANAGHRESTLEEWLRDSFFEEHCKLFHHRPFVWHIWDGERDGFHALVNYHRLAAPNGEGARLLQKLAQTYLGDWIARCEADVKNDKPNAHKLLKAAKELQADLLKILEGEAPHDIFVRWKPLHGQSIGWNPDINDGVRLNIRPFLTVRDVGKKGAGVLRWKPNIKWDKDRGSEPQRPKAQFPWFWSCLPEDKTDHVTDFAGGTEFTGERWNNLHYTLAIKKAARARKK